MSNADTFWTAYEKNLADAVRNFPTQYPKGVQPESFAKSTAAKFRDADPKDINVDGRGFFLTCKQLGIPKTRKAILAYLSGG